MSRKNTSPSFLEEGSIKGDVKKKHFPVLLRGGFFLASSPSAAARFGAGAWIGLREHLVCVVPWELFAPASSVLAKGQPWFYLRLATQLGTIPLLGCPREPTVPR